MKQNLLLFGMLFVMVAVSVAAADGPTGKTSTSAPLTTNGLRQQVIAYYFHGTVRCETCLKIENQAKKVIERQFKTEMDTKRLVFKSIDYDQPQNSHFLHDYKLPCPSLVLVRRKDGQDKKWTLLDNTWKLADEPAKFNAYIEKEVAKFLTAAK